MRDDFRLRKKLQHGLCRWVVHAPPARNSVGSAAPDAVDLGEEIDPRSAFDAGFGHSGFEFVGGDEGPRLFQTLPFAEEVDVVDISRTAENSATAFAVLVPPVQGSIECGLPDGVVGDFVVNEKVDHDLGHTPFQRQTLLQMLNKCKSGDHRGVVKDEESARCQATNSRFALSLLTGNY